MHLHILGICGTFMGGIAAIAKAAGHTVTGCDVNVYPPMSTQLEALGIDLVEGWEASQLEGVARGAEVFVVGNAVTRGKPVMEAILNRGLPYISGPQWLFDNVLLGRWVLAVAGTHGKTTTTAMLAQVLEAAGLTPGFLIGGVPIDFEFSARLTDSNFFVIEADEYDTAFFDKRSKFVHYRPRTVILNNLEFDHADIFSDLGAIEAQFHHLVRTVPGEGMLVVNAREASLQRVLERGCWSGVERFGQAADWDLDAGGEVYHQGKPQGRLALEMPGRHNQMNALAALLAARHVGVPVAQGLAALARFKGVKRRLEKRGEVRGVTVYDDFAHHPTAIAATLAALKSRSGDARLIAVFEPRSNTMKLGAMKAQLPASLALADLSFCFAGGLTWDAAAALAPLGDQAETYTDLEQLVARLAAVAQAGDQILCMSNGGFGGIHDKLLRALA